MKGSSLSIAWVGGVLALAASARADVIWNEPVQGDLSDNRFSPTHFTLALGSNQLIGFMAGGNGHGPGQIDRDYFSMTIPAGMMLAQINLQDYESIDLTAFIGIQPGPVFPDDPTTVQAGDLFGWAHFGPGDVGSDLLQLMGTQGQGFTPPLPAGTYSFWAQQTDDPTDWLTDFVVIPAPGAGWIVGIGLVGVRRNRGRG